MVLTYKREPLEEEEIQALRKACRTFEEEFIINVLLETGMRISELTNLVEEQISWQRSCITTIGKGNKRRVIPMSTTTRFYLSNFFKNNTKLKITPRSVQLKVKAIAERAKIHKPVSPHVLRHTFAVTYLHRRGNIRALQEILGHSSIAITDIYLNYSGARVIEDFQRIWETNEPKNQP